LLNTEIHQHKQIAPGTQAELKDGSSAKKKGLFRNTDKHVQNNLYPRLFPKT